MTHRLKALDVFFEAVKEGRKQFEIRKNDRNFHVGDIVVLEEVNEECRPTGRSLTRKIMYITEFKQQEGYVIFGMCGPRKKI